MKWSVFVVVISILRVYDIIFRKKFTVKKCNLIRVISCLKRYCLFVDHTKCYDDTRFNKKKGLSSNLRRKEDYQSNCTFFMSS